MEDEYPRRLASKAKRFAVSCCVHAVLWLFLAGMAFPVHASHHYTDRQLDALGTRVGKNSIGLLQSTIKRRLFLLALPPMLLPSVLRLTNRSKLQSWWAATTEIHITR